jgi:sn-glycerol 3-phosphate transport system substrate-binding protein
MAMQMNRRQLLKTLGVGAGMMALAACAPAAPGAAPSSDSGAAAPAAEGVTITFWSSFTGANGEAETALVEKFNEENAGAITLDYQFQGSYEETAQKVTAALQAQTAPDVSLLSDVWWFKFI